MNPREDWSLRKEKKGGKIYICVCVRYKKYGAVCVLFEIEKQKRGGKMLTRKK